MIFEFRTRIFPLAVVMLLGLVSWVSAQTTAASGDFAEELKRQARIQLKSFGATLPDDALTELDLIIDRGAAVIRNDEDPTKEQEIARGNLRQLIWLVLKRDPSADASGQTAGVEVDTTKTSALALAGHETAAVDSPEPEHATGHSTGTVSEDVGSTVGDDADEDDSQQDDFWTLKIRGVCPPPRLYPFCLN